MDSVLFTFPAFALSIILSGGLKLSSQSLKTDSLYTVYQHTDDDSIRIAAGVELVDAYGRLRPLEVTGLGFEIQAHIDTALSTGSCDSAFLELSRISSLQDLATAYANLGDWNRNLELLLQVLAAVQDDPYQKHHSSALANLGVLHQTLGHYEEARNYYLSNI